MRTALHGSILVTLFLSGMCEARAQGTSETGRHLAQRLCARCHAIAHSDSSPFAGAPPFRNLEPRVDLDELQENFQRGLLAGHPDMPVFKLTPAEARALVVYLKSIRAP